RVQNSNILFFVKDRNNDRQFRLVFWGSWRSFDSPNGLALTAIVDRWVGSEHAGKRLTKLQRRPRIFRGNIGEIAALRMFLSVALGRSFAQFTCQLGIHFCVSDM